MPSKRVPHRRKSNRRREVKAPRRRRLIYDVRLSRLIRSENAVGRFILRPERLAREGEAGGGTPLSRVESLARLLRILSSSRVRFSFFRLLLPLAVPKTVRRRF